MLGPSISHPVFVLTPVTFSSRRDEPNKVIISTFSRRSNDQPTALGATSESCYMNFPRHLCAFLVPSLWLINYALPQRGHREAQRFLA